MRYLEESFCYQRKDLFRNDSDERAFKYVNRHVVEIDDEVRTFYGLYDFHESKEKEYMKKLNAYVSSENFVRGVVNGYSIGLSTNAFMLIVFSTQWRLRKDRGQYEIGVGLINHAIMKWIKKEGLDKKEISTRMKEIIPVTRRMFK